MGLRDEINERLDHLQAMLESQQHINHPEIVEAQIESVAKFYSALSEEDREYVGFARDALEEQFPWNV